MEEVNDKVQFVLRVKSDLNSKLVNLADKKEISKNRLINQIIKEYFAKGQDELIKDLKRNNIPDDDIIKIVNFYKSIVRK